MNINKWYNDFYVRGVSALTDKERYCLEQKFFYKKKKSQISSELRVSDTFYMSAKRKLMVASRLEDWSQEHDWIRQTIRYYLPDVNIHIQEELFEYLTQALSLKELNYKNLAIKINYTPMLLHRMKKSRNLNHREKRLIEDINIVRKASFRKSSAMNPKEVFPGCSKAKPMAIKQEVTLGRTTVTVSLDKAYVADILKGIKKPANTFERLAIRRAYNIPIKKSTYAFKKEEANSLIDIFLKEGLNDLQMHYRLNTEGHPVALSYIRAYIKKGKK